MDVITHTLTSGNVLVVDPYIDFGEAIFIAVFIGLLALAGLNFLQELVYHRDD